MGRRQTLFSFILLSLFAGLTACATTTPTTQTGATQAASTQATATQTTATQSTQTPSVTTQATHTETAQAPNTQTQTDKSQSRHRQTGETPAPIYDAAPLDTAQSQPITRDIVIAENDDGVSTSWSSITDNPAMRTAAELSNLGGAPVVIGAVATMVAFDAKPKGRAKRTAQSINGGLEAGALDAGLAETLETALDDNPDLNADIRVQPIERLRDIPEDAWLIFTDYTVSEDGTALRATARVGHAADYRRALEIERERRRQEQLAYSRNSDYRYQLQQRERMRRLRQRTYRPRYTNSFVYHSDRLLLPEAGDLRSDDQRENLEAALIRALHAERDARYAFADAVYESEIAKTEKARTLKRAARKRDKAYAKADAQLAKSLELATDGELDKMERMVLGAAKWREISEDTETEEAMRIAAAVEDAQAFFASALAVELPGFASETLEESWLTTPPTEEEIALGRRIIAKAEDDRRVVQILTGDQAGSLISLPDEGTADYGLQSADP